MVIDNSSIRVKGCAHGGQKTGKGLWDAEECGIFGGISKQVCLRAIIENVVGGSARALAQENRAKGDQAPGSGF